jgi:alkylation response protein AidB-like acyl-CoA dehydrogenase
MAFFQSPPVLSSSYEDDAFFRAWMQRHLPGDAHAAIVPELREMAALSTELYAQRMAERHDEPRLVQWDAWGKRIDHIELSALWKKAARIAAEKGVVATAYERKSGEFSRIHQFALAYLIEPSWAVYSCPLAMTDGAAKTLITSKNTALVERAVTRLTSRDPDLAWTSGQWMTERTGGSDVAISETLAREEGGVHKLFGTKWFTSATTSQMALTLARPEGGTPGGSGLALFYVETRDAEGNLNGIRINRLKDKLGTRSVPTAELSLEGAIATPVIGLRDGIKNITPMLAVTRTWNAVCSVAAMRKAVALAHDYAKKRVAFGAPLSEKPLHVDTLAAMTAESRAAFCLAFRVVELLGREEANVATESERALARLLTPIVKLTTGKQVVSVASEALEAFGGAGYVEDTGLPELLRDAQVLPIWEGTTNVLSLDVLRALARGTTLDPLRAEIARATEGAPAELSEPAKVARAAFDHAERWAMATLARGPQALEAGARRFALTLGRATELALLVDEASHALRNGDARLAATARRFARTGIDLVDDDLADADSMLAAFG